MAPPKRGTVSFANRIFVDREAPRRVFEKAAFAIPADGAILRVFYGIGGQGKTALCRALMRETDPAVEPTYAFLRRAELDLHGRSKEDPDRLLVWIRNGFAEDGVVFPCFDLAFALAWEATRGDEPVPVFAKPWLRRWTAAGKFGVEEASSIAVDAFKDAGGELLGSIPGVGFMLKRIGHWSIEKGKRVYLESTREALRALYDGAELRKPYELSQLLPWMLAQDLNAHRERNPEDRFVLFVDEYERVADEGGSGARWRENPFDAHMRRLIAETGGLLAVFFSRERLPWESDPDWRQDLAGNQHLLGGLADGDADEFLRAVPIDDDALRRAMLDGSRETAAPGAPIYPLMLDLQVEHWSSLKLKGELLDPRQFRVAATSFEGRRSEIVQRVLRDYGLPLQLTLQRLSVARRFDRAAFGHIVATFGTALPLDQFDRIAGLSFVTGSPDGFLSMHNLVAETIRGTLDPSVRASSVAALLDHFESRARTETPRDVTQAVVAAFVEAAYLRLAQGVEGYVAWLESTGSDIEQSALATDGIPLWREVVVRAEAELGPDHADTATSLNNLAGLLRAVGNYSAARPLYERALAIREKILGPNHPDEATSLNDLAVLFLDMGDYGGARPLLERALAIEEKCLGPDDPRTAAGLNNLAGFFHETGNYSAARPLYERALASWELSLGPDHPRTATSLNNLARLWGQMGDYSGAQPLLERALTIREQSLGPDHADTAASLDSLAGLLQAVGDYSGARPLYERALAIREKSLGPDHPHTATSLNNLAGLLQAGGDYSGARPHYERALAIREKILGADHLHTAVSLDSLAGLLRALGDYIAARPHCERALAIREKSLRPDHLHTSISLDSLAGLLKDTGDYSGARPLYERALAIREKSLGPDHPHTATSLNNLAALLRDLGDLGGARPLYERALAIREEGLGPDHPDTAASLNNLACLLRDMGDYEMARPLQERALAIWHRSLGPDHPNTNRARRNLAELQRLAGRPWEALDHAETALAAHEKGLGLPHPWTKDSARSMADALDALGRDGEAKAIRERHSL